MKKLQYVAIPLICFLAVCALAAGCGRAEQKELKRESFEELGIEGL